MTDNVVTNTPTAPPPQPAASDVPVSSGEEVAALAQPENIEKYVEQRREDELSPEERKKTQSEHRLSRYERLKAARDNAQAEAVELRAQLEGRPYWKKSETAPEGVIAQVRVTDGCGSDYLLPYPCKLTKDGWVNAASGKLLAVRPTYWKLYVETLSRKKPRERSPQLNPPQAERD